MLQYNVLIVFVLVEYG